MGIDLTPYEHEILALRNYVEANYESILRLAKARSMEAIAILGHIADTATSIARELKERILPELSGLARNYVLSAIRCLENVATLTRGATSVISILSSESEIVRSVANSLRGMIANLSTAISLLERAKSEVAKEEKARETEVQGGLTASVSSFTVTELEYPKIVRKPLAVVKIHYLAPSRARYQVEAIIDGLTMASLSFVASPRGTVSLPVPLLNKEGKQSIEIKIVDEKGNTVFDKVITIELERVSKPAIAPQPQPKRPPEISSLAPMHRHGGRHVRIRGEKVIKIAYI